MNIHRGNCSKGAPKLLHLFGHQHRGRCQLSPEDGPTHGTAARKLNNERAAYPCQDLPGDASVQREVLR